VCACALIHARRSTQAHTRRRSPQHAGGGAVHLARGGVRRRLTCRQRAAPRPARRCPPAPPLPAPPRLSNPPSPSTRQLSTTANIYFPQRRVTAGRARPRGGHLVGEGGDGGLEARRVPRLHEERLVPPQPPPDIPALPRPARSEAARPLPRQRRDREPRAGRGGTFQWARAELRAE
jgi:hypothetical protein